MFSSSSSSSMGGSLALAAATAMAVSAGSLVIFSLCRFARTAHDDCHPASSSLRPCISSSSSFSGRRRQRGGNTAEKRVRFAEGVVDNEGAAPAARSSSLRAVAAAATEPTCRGSSVARERMPANREALYRGMLRNRSLHRTACSC